MYGLSGAAILRPLPLLRPTLVGIAAIYLIRGVVIIPAVLARLESPGQPGSGTEILSASVALVSGVAYATGTAAGWAELRGPLEGRPPVA